MVVALGLGSAFVLTGCGGDQKRALTAEEYAENARQAYEEALESFYDHDWVGVIPLMEEIKREYASSRYARLAQLRIADAQFHQELYPEAITSSRDFVRDYPNDPAVPFARYKIALTQFNSSGASALLPPLEERDLASVRDAHESIRAFLRDYPNYPKRTELLYMQEWVKGMLARYELYVARYYLDRDNFEAAVSRAQYALINYEDTGLEPEAMVLLAETYMKQGEKDKARSTLNAVLERYPASAFAVPAKRFLAQLGEPVKTQRIGATAASPN